MSWAIVTGASKGIGKSIAMELAKQCSNLKILALSRKIESSTATLKEFKASSSNIVCMNADVGNKNARQQVMNYIQQNGKIQYLIHNAGISGDTTKTLNDVSEEDFYEIMKTNVESALFLTQTAFKMNLFQQKARVLHMNSGLGTFAVEKCGLYCMSKAALLMLDQVYRLEIKNVLFTSIRPGIVDTDMLQSIVNTGALKLKTQKGHMPSLVGKYVSYILTKTTDEEYQSQKMWNIYDLNFQQRWLPPEMESLKEPW